jgi:hypothetical protein
VWELDLKQIQEIESVVIHMRLQGEQNDKILSYTPGNIDPIWRKGVLIFRKRPEMFNRLPLVVAISTSRFGWKVVLVEKADTQHPMVLKLEQPEPARYIRILASGQSRLCLNEVEVYPPPSGTSKNSSDTEDHDAEN